MIIDLFTQGVSTDIRLRKGRGRGRPLQQPHTSSSSDLSTASSLSFEEEPVQASVTTQLEKSSDESVLSLTLPPVQQAVSDFLPPQPRLHGLFPGQVTDLSLSASLCSTSCSCPSS